MRAAQQVIRRSSQTYGHDSSKHSLLSEDPNNVAIQEDECFQPQRPKNDFIAFKNTLWGNKFLSMMLLFIPLGMISHYAEWSATLNFIFNFLAIMPLAWLMGQATEELALRTNETFGGLLNATFGNATELIIAIVAIRKHKKLLVQTSLLGSILSNLLLVLGMSFFAGGLKKKTQQFNQAGAGTFSSLLFMACLALVLPATFSNAFDIKDNVIVMISHATAIILFLLYVAYLIFQLYTHQHMFMGEETTEQEEPEYSIIFSVFLLATVTIFVAFCSEFLVDSVSEVTKQWGMNQAFVGMILLPIVGNAAEHTTAITVALKDKMDLSIGVAVGSSTQIALFAVPVAVFVAWMIGEPLTLDFRMFETVCLVMAVFITNLVVNDGESNWLEGAMLMCAYVIIAISFWFHPEHEA